MNQKSLQYTVIRKPRRKTASIIVSRSNQVSVVVPVWISRGQIEEIIKKKQSWIQKRFHLNEAHQKLFPKREFKNGEIFHFLGRPHSLASEPANGQESVMKENDCLRVFTREPANIRGLLISWYTAELEKLLAERVPFFETQAGVQAREVKIKNLESQWGNCRTGEILTFNWKMVMAPLDVIDYIIVHEICHLTHLDHSKNFWRKVESVFPDYQTARRWLRVNGDSLEL